MWLVIVFCSISEQTEDAGNWCIVTFLVNKIGHTLVVHAIDH